MQHDHSFLNEVEKREKWKRKRGRGRCGARKLQWTVGKGASRKVGKQRDHMHNLNTGKGMTTARERGGEKESEESNTREYITVSQ